MVDKIVVDKVIIKNMKKFAAHYALLPDGLLERPLIETDDLGRILSISQYDDPAALDASAATQFHAGVLLPSLVNAHCHLELSYLKGAIPRGCGYAGFAAAMAAVRNHFTPEQRACAIAEADRRLFESGTGAVGDIANDDSSFAVKRSSRLAYRTFAEVFGLRTPNTDIARQLLDYPATTLTPHSLYSLNDREFKALCREGDGLLSIHFMESPAERQLFEGHGPLLDWYARAGFDCDFLHYASPAERLTACVSADRSVMLVHCTCVTQKDIDLIMSHFRAPVYWCLSPRSNDFISGLQPDTDLLRRNGLQLCIGTDSLASNTSLSLADELLALADRVPALELLRAATATAARALGVGERAGRLDVGARCGLVVAEGVDVDGDRLTKNFALRRVV